MLMSSTKLQPFKRSGCGDKDNSFYEIVDYDGKAIVLSDLCQYEP